MEETHRVIEANWTLGTDKPRFDNEVLVAHGPRKCSYHIIIKMYDTGNNEVLLKNFGVCKTLASTVNTNLGDSILVDRKPGHGGKTKPEPTSFIDLAIYTKDRPFRLVLSSKIISPDRPFVGCRFSFQGGRDDKTIVVDTLVVPPDPIDHRTIEIGVNAANNDVSLRRADTDKRDERAPPCIGNTVPMVGSNNAAQMPRNSSNSEDRYPLLDYGKECVAKIALSYPIPAPFRALVPWVSRLAGDLPGAAREGLAVRAAHYECSKSEAYIHFTLNRGYASYCHNIGRPHNEQNIMITIDLLAGIAYQRCWDRSCKNRITKGSARHLLSRNPPGEMPTPTALENFGKKTG